MSYDSPSVPPEVKARLDALKDSMSSPSRYRVDGYPPDVQEVLDVVCELWNLRAPMHKKDKGYWIESARRLLDACGEFGLDCIRAYHKDFHQYMLDNHGLAPHTVEGPGSLIKSVRAKAAMMRTPKSDTNERRIAYVKGSE